MFYCIFQQLCSLFVFRKKENFFVRARPLSLQSMVDCYLDDGGWGLISEWTDDHTWFYFTDWPGLVHFLVLLLWQWLVWLWRRTVSPLAVALLHREINMKKWEWENKNKTSWRGDGERREDAQSKKMDWEMGEKRNEHLHRWSMGEEEGRWWMVKVRREWRCWGYDELKMALSSSLLSKDPPVC